jgi:mannose-6-phosphate isomerase-like protein (cupin superfamily)
VSGTLLVAHAEDPARVHGVHGAAGTTYWTCFARRAGLDGDWEAIEWARVPPGGVSGEHRHTRTEEIYFILSGAAEVRLDGKPYLLGPGGMVLTAVGSTHALHNVGSTPVDWLVIEMLAPPTAAAVRGRPAGGTPQEERTDMGSTVVVDLRETGAFDPSKAFAGPLEEIRLRRLAEAESLLLASSGREHTVFVTEGSGHAEHEGQRVELVPGTSLTLPLGGSLTLHGGPSGLEIFHAAMRVNR